MLRSESSLRLWIYVMGGWLTMGWIDLPISGEGTYIVRCASDAKKGVLVIVTGLRWAGAGGNHWQILYRELI